MALSKDEIMDAIKEMSVLELSELVKELEEVFGVSAAAPIAMATVQGVAGTVEAAAEEEKTEFDVTIQEIGPNKINVIKAVREVTTLGLKEAKELVEAAPSAVKEAIGKDEADQVKEKLEIFTGIECKNQYRVMNGLGQQLFLAAEQGEGIFEFLRRSFLKAARPFTMQLLTPDGMPTLVFKRPFRFFFHRIEVFDRGGALLGQEHRIR